MNAFRRRQIIFLLVVSIRTCLWRQQTNEENSEFWIAFFLLSLPVYFEWTKRRRQKKMRTEKGSIFSLFEWKYSVPRTIAEKNTDGNVEMLSLLKKRINRPDLLDNCNIIYVRFIKEKTIRAHIRQSIDEQKQIEFTRKCEKKNVKWDFSLRSRTKIKDQFACTRPLFDSWDESFPSKGEILLHLKMFARRHFKSNIKKKSAKKSQKERRRLSFEDRNGKLNDSIFCWFLHQSYCFGSAYFRRTSPVNWR